MSSKTAKDLQTITGLKEQQAKGCFDAFGNYAAALASFAQSYAGLPQDYFADTTAAKKNAAQINLELRAIYVKARALKAAGAGKTDADIWKSYPSSDAAEEAKPAAAPTPAVSSSPFGFGAAVTPPANPFGAAAAKAAEAKSPAPSPFGASAFGKPAAATSSVLGGAAKPAATSAPAASPFGFGGSTPAAASAFGFGAAPAAASGAAAPAASVFGGAVPATTEPEVKKAPVKYCAAKHFTGPYFEMPDFWEKEVIERAPLLNLNNGFLEAHKEELRPRLERWLSKTSFYRSPVKYVEIEDEDEEVVRVIIKDADRTFFEPAHRAKMVAFLNAMYHEFNAYGQAMSYLAGLCMLVLNEEETASIIRYVSREQIQGHWAAEAVGFAMSAWVVEYFMRKKDPEVAEHLNQLNFWPDTYLQKILTGLCIHVLQFNELFDFLDAFMDGGLAYLIRFSLAIVEHFRKQLLNIKSSVEANEMYAIMRLDSSVADKGDVRAILDRAPSIDLGEDAANLAVIRSEMYDKKVGPRLSKAPKTATFEPCEECEKNRPVWWNEDLGALCEECKKKHPDDEFEKY